MPGERYWTILTDTARRAQTTGNLVFDTQIAAVCLEHGVEALVSEDRDFTRFRGLTVIPI